MFVGNDSYPPISYQEGGKPKGLAIDIVRALGQRMGRQIDIRLMEWKVDAVLADLWSGSYVLAEKMITGT